MKKPLLFGIGPKSAVTIFVMLLRSLAFVLVSSLAAGCFGGAQPEPPNSGENDPDNEVRGDAGTSYADAGLPSGWDAGDETGSDAAVVSGADAGCTEDGGSHDDGGSYDDAGATSRACDSDGGHAH